MDDSRCFVFHSGIGKKDPAGVKTGKNQEKNQKGVTKRHVLLNFVYLRVLVADKVSNLPFI
jgi:hypothetical protein